MTSEEANVAMMLELEEKITRRIREQIYMAADGNEFEPGTLPVTLDAYSLHNALRANLFNDEIFISAITKKIGSKMANIY